MHLAFATIDTEELGRVDTHFLVVLPSPLGPLLVVDHDLTDLLLLLASFVPHPCCDLEAKFEGMEIMILVHHKLLQQMFPDSWCFSSLASAVPEMLISG